MNVNMESDNYLMETNEKGLDSPTGSDYYPQWN